MHAQTALLTYGYELKYAFFLLFWKTTRRSCAKFFSGFRRTLVHYNLH